MEWFRIFKENFFPYSMTLSVDFCPLSEAAFTLLFSQSPLSASIVVCSIRLFSFLLFRWPYFQSYWMAYIFSFLFELGKALFSNESLRQREIYSFEILGDGTNRCLMIFRVSRGEKFFFRSSGIEEATSTLESEFECANIWFLWELNFFKVFVALESTWVVELRYARNRMGWQGKFESNDFRIIALNDFSSHFIEMFVSHTPIVSIWIELEKEKRIVMKEKKQKNWKNSSFFCSRRCCSHSHFASAWYSIQFLLFSSCAASSTRAERNWIEYTKKELGDSLGN